MYSTYLSRATLEMPPAVGLTGQLQVAAHNFREEMTPYFVIF
jgi:hypothetical protein